jgi:hypothetical protein
MGGWGIISILFIISFPVLGEVIIPDNGKVQFQSIFIRR